MLTKEELEDGFTLGDCEILPNEGKVRRGDTEIRPEPQTLRVLLCLAQRDGKLVSKEDLIDEIWDGRAIADDPINRAINQVRKCLGDSGKEPTYVETLHRRGYRTLQPVQLLNPPEEPVATSASPDPGLRRWKVVASILVVGLGGIIWSNWPPHSDSLPPPLPNSIAVLPFQNLSGQSSDQYILSGFKIALVQALHAMPGFSVKNVRELDVEDSNDPATAFNVESIVDASLQRNGEMLRISYEVSKDGKVQFSGNIDGTGSDLFPLQEQLSRAVRIDFGDDLSQALITGHRPESDAYDSYMRGVHELEHRGDKGNLEDAIDLFKKAIQKDANYGPSYLALATAYALMPDYRQKPTASGRQAQLEEMNGLALKTIEDGIAADPIIAEPAGAIYGFVRHKEKRWQEAEESHLRAVNADVVDSNAFNWYSRMLASVGRTDDALEQALRALEIDPRSFVINSRVAMTYTWLDDSEKAHEFFERSNELGAGGSTHNLAYAFLLARDGRLDESRLVTTNGMELAGEATVWIEPVFAALSDSANVPAALMALDEASAAGHVSAQVEVIIRTQFGDVDGAMQVAERLEDAGEIFEMDLLYVTELKPLREHPDFMPLLDRLGITDYWKTNGCAFKNDKLSCAKN
jgi:DNA-binding winged helix-turn-helix (wHTH) protein/tetratricopeptide (TPR) repeat protein